MACGRMRRKSASARKTTSPSMPALNCRTPATPICPCAHFLVVVVVVVPSLLQPLARAPTRSTFETSTQHSLCLRRRAPSAAAVVAPAISQSIDAFDVSPPRYSAVALPYSLVVSNFSNPIVTSDSTCARVICWSPARARSSALCLLPRQILRNVGKFRSSNCEYGALQR